LPINHFVSLNEKEKDMFARALVAKLLAMLGVAFVKAAIAVGGAGKCDCEVAVFPREVEPFWLVFYSIALLPVFWFVFSVFFAATGDM